MLDLTTVAKAIEKAEVLLLGCSAGGFSLVYDLLLSVPANFPLPIIVVIHRSRKHKSSLESLLRKKAYVHVNIAGDQEMIKSSVIYFAPSDYHLLVEPNGTLTLDSSEPLFFCRPSIDVTFESFADVYKDKTIGILMSGANEDGANGIAYIERVGGLAIVQNPDEAEVRTMPEAAISRSKAVHILTNEEIFGLISQIVQLKQPLN